MLQLILGKAGYGKTTCIHKQIIADRAENKNLRQVLLVPDQFSFESERMLLQNPDIEPTFDDDLQVLSFNRMAQIIREKTGEKSKKTINSACKVAMMMRALTLVKNELQLYKKVYESDGFAKKMVGIIKEFKQTGITAGKLSEIASGLEPKALQTKMADHALIYKKYDELISKSYTDSDDALIALNKTLTTHNEFKNTHVYIDGFADFTEVQQEIIAQILQQSQKVYAAFCIDKMNSEAIYFEGVRRCIGRIIADATDAKIKILPEITLDTPHRFKTSELKTLSDNFFAPKVTQFNKKPENITLAHVLSLKDEAVFTCRKIRELVMQKNYRYKDMAVIMRDSTRYKGILLAEFKKYNIPIYNNENIKLSSTTLFKLINAMLTVITKDFKTDDIINLIKNDLYNFCEDETIALENYANIWRKVNLNWHEDFTLSTSGFDSRPDKNEKAKLEMINISREKVMKDLYNLALNFKTENAEKIGESIYNWLVNLNIENKIRENSEKNSTENLAKSFEKLVEILEILAQIFTGENADISEFVRIFNVLANNTTLSEIPGRIDEVTFGDIEQIILNNPKIVFVLGANADVFPNLSTDGILNIAERKALRSKEINVNDYAENFAVNEHFLAYTAFLSPAEKLFITYSKTDLSGAGMLVSSFINEIKNIFPQICEVENIGNNINTATKNSLLDFAKSFTEQNSCIIRGYIKEFKPQIFAQLQYYKQMPENLSEDVAREIIGEKPHLSASKIEKFYRCKFAYFLQNTMQLKPLKIAEISAMQRGIILHYIIEFMLNKYELADLINMNDSHLGEIQFEISRYIKQFADDKILDDFHYNILEIAETAYYTIENIVAELSQSGFKVEESERKINEDDGEIIFKGSIDRIDVLKENGAKYVRVIDYKTGDKKFNLNEIIYGQNMQMLIYLFKACEDLGDNAIPSAVLYVPVKYNIKKADFFNADNEKIEKKYKKSLKMNGIILDDNAIIEKLAQASDYLPISLNKDGSLSKSSSTLTANQFKVLQNYIALKINKMTNDLRNGEIEINPFKNKDKSACDYCDFKEICRDKQHKNANEFEKLENTGQIISQMQAELERGAAQCR